MLSIRSSSLVAAGALSLGAIANFSLAVDRLVANQAEFVNALSASAPGDSVTLRNGVWSNLNVNFQSINGSAAAPVQIRAQTPGQVVITGPNWFFDIGGNNYEVSGLTFKDVNNNLKSIRFRGTAANVHDNAMLLGGRYHQVIFDAKPNAQGDAPQFHHNFAAGKQDRGLIIQLDNSFRTDLYKNYFGHRPEGGPSGNTNGWETIRIGVSTIMDSSLQANIRDNYFESTNGEAETISDKTHDNFIHDNTFRNVVKGWVTARHGGGGTYSGNMFINSLGIRVGNNDDTIADHPGLTIRNNYIEGPNGKILLPGYQTDATIDRNTVIVTAGAYNNSGYTTGKFGIEYTNTNPGTLTNNISWINDASYGAVQAFAMGSISPAATGGGNFAYQAGTGPVFSLAPSNIRSLFSVANPQFVRDAYGIQRPSNSAMTNAGAGVLSTPGARNSDVGPTWLDPVMRLNKFMPLELKFNGDYTDGVVSQIANNTGYLSTPAIGYASVAAGSANLHTAGGIGVSGRVDDRAFDNRATLAMGIANGSFGRVETREWFYGLEALTLTGWFKTDGTQTIGNGASLIDHATGGGGWSLKANSPGALTLAINSGTNSASATSNANYTAADQWTFFAVTFDARPSSNEVSFYIGSETNDVSSAGTRSLNVAMSAEAVIAFLVFGDRFDGLLDNMRLFSARRQITYTDDTGTTFTKNGNGQDYAILSLAELRTIRRFDLGIAIGDVNESRTIDATDIDLVRANAGNALYDVDGDFDTDRGDFDLLVYNILHTGPGDANLDGVVNISDFAALAASFNTIGGWAKGNFNTDAVVDISDFALLAGNFNRDFPRTAIPETTLGSLLLLGAMVSRRLRNRPSSSRRRKNKLVAEKFSLDVPF